MQHNSRHCLTPGSQLLFTAFSAYNLQLCACHAGKFGLRSQQTTLDAITISGFLSIYLFAMFVSYPCFSTNIDVLFVKGCFASLIIQPRPGPVRVGYERSTVHPNSLGQLFSHKSWFFKKGNKNTYPVVPKQFYTRVFQVVCDSVKRIISKLMKKIRNNQRPFTSKNISRKFKYSSETNERKSPLYN